MCPATTSASCAFVFLRSLSNKWCEADPDIFGAKHKLEDWEVKSLFRKIEFIDSMLWSVALRLTLISLNRVMCNLTCDSMFRKNEMSSRRQLLIYFELCCNLEQLFHGKWIWPELCVLIHHSYQSMGSRNYVFVSEIKFHCNTWEVRQSVRQCFLKKKWLKLVTFYCEISSTLVGKLGNPCSLKVLLSGHYDHGNFCCSQQLL